ncbi:hypothetical protein [Peptostreptococcus russellii]|uniref:hypothetical protein n=1 Tax=Peptostreptococcus russellii TaxID=215200 RepID=UPI002942FA62|nr:hypothetical protein [Peptostreptococcus russellii]
MDSFAINDQIYIIALNTDNMKNGWAINPKNYEIIETKIINIYKDEIKVELEKGRRKRSRLGNISNMKLRHSRSVMK